MANLESRRTLTVEEFRKRFSRASNVIDLGAGSLLGPSSSLFSEEETEASLKRLLAEARKNSTTQ